MGKRILIVEAESEICAGVEFLLRHEGHSVEVAVTAADAMERLEEFQPDVVLITAALPDGGGCELCQTLRYWMRNTHGVLPRVWLFAAVPDAQMLASAQAAGAEDVIALPFVTLDVLARLRPFLREAASAV